MNSCTEDIEGGEIVEATCRNHRLNGIAIPRCLNLELNDVLFGIYTKKGCQCLPRGLRAQSLAILKLQVMEV